MLGQNLREYVHSPCPVLRRALTYGVKSVSYAPRQSCIQRIKNAQHRNTIFRDAAQTGCSMSQLKLSTQSINSNQQRQRFAFYDSYRAQTHAKIAKLADFKGDSANTQVIQSQSLEVSAHLLPKRRYTSRFCGLLHTRTANVPRLGKHAVVSKHAKPRVARVSTIDLSTGKPMLPSMVDTLI